MELKVYNWEYFERSKIRYLVFALIILVVIVISFLSKNILWWVLVLVFTWAYIYILTRVNNETKMVVWKNSLQVWKTPFLRSTLKWFVLEYHTQKEKIHNIVIIDNKNTAKIFTINDTEKNLKNFVNELSNYIQIMDNYDQTKLDKFMRKIKL